MARPGSGRPVPRSGRVAPAAPRTGSADPAGARGQQGTSDAGARGRFRSANNPRIVASARSAMLPAGGARSGTSGTASRVVRARNAVAAPASIPIPIHATVAPVARGANSTPSARKAPAPVFGARATTVAQPAARWIPRESKFVAARPRSTPARVKRKGTSTSARREPCPVLGRSARPVARPTRPVTPARGPACGNNAAGFVPALTANQLPVTFQRSITPAGDRGSQARRPLDARSERDARL